MRSCLPSIAVLSILSSRLFAGPITVDGHWTDWGIQPGGGDWSSSTGQRIFYEDYTGSDGGAYVGPGWGGQYFDVEAIYAQRAGQDLYFAIVTGFDPDGVIYLGSPYTPGDIFLNAGNGWNVGIDLETGHVFTGATSTNPADFPASAPFTIAGGTDIGATALSVPFDGSPLVYGSGNQTSTHFFFEGYLDLTRIGGADGPVGIHWTMSCGNDVGRGYIGYVEPPAVPEPGTLGLLGIGSLAAAVVHRRRQRSGRP